MSLSLHTIRPAKGSTKKRKRVGRGNASGHGTTATRGTKGQKSRTGVSRLKLKRLGLRTVMLPMPKYKGFQSKRPKAMVVNLSVIAKNFKDGETVNPSTLFKKGLVDSSKGTIKILGKGELTVKSLKFQGVKMSEKAKKIVGNK